MTVFQLSLNPKVINHPIDILKSIGRFRFKIRHASGAHVPPLQQTPIGIDRTPRSRKYYERSGEPCPRDILLGWGREVVKHPILSTHFIFFFYKAGFEQR